MNSLTTYPIQSQATAWLHCAGMFLRIGKPGFGLGSEAADTRPNCSGENSNREAGS